MAWQALGRGQRQPACLCACCDVPSQAVGDPASTPGCHLTALFPAQVHPPALPPGGRGHAGGSSDGDCGVCHDLLLKRLPAHSGEHSGISAAGRRCWRMALQGVGHPEPGQRLCGETSPCCVLCHWTSLACPAVSALILGRDGDPSVALVHLLPRAASSLARVPPRLELLCHRAAQICRL